MTHRVVYDTMVFFQWAALPPDRTHGTQRAVEQDQITLCMSRDLLLEISDLLQRPAIRAKAEHLTSDRVLAILLTLHQKARFFGEVPNVFHWSHHPDDDHIFNLAIASKAKYLVTWETRILEMDRVDPAGAKEPSDLLAMNACRRLLQSR